MIDLINPVVRRWLQDSADPEAFWARAAEKLHWFRQWEQVFEWNYPTFRWFLGGQTNMAYNCLDYHVQRGWGGHTALVYANERGEHRVFTYAQLLYQVERVAAALRGMGIQKGDRVTIYMPTCPETVILMLATIRIGAIHSLVFAGFGSGALADRIKASESRLVFTSDITYRKGKDIGLKDLLDSALDAAGNVVEHAIVLKRNDAELPMTENRDLTWEAFLACGEGQSSAYEPMESNDPAYILATSGTTAKPKLAIHTHGGYQVYIHSMGNWCFGLNQHDVWWATADIGWAVGHSYIVYAPLLAGATTIVYEGALDFPHAGVIGQVFEEFCVTGVFTSPTAVRLLMRYGEDIISKYRIPYLERVFCAGEVLNPPAWEWLQKQVLKDRVPVIDHMWQTETGGPVFGNPYGLAMLPIKPGSSGIALPGIEAAVVTPEGEPCAPGEKGIMVFKRPFPGLTARLWGEPERYGREYWERIKGVYYTGDSAHIDEDGYVWFAGRADEIIKIAGHRIGTIEVESAILKHPAVAEAGVTGRPDELRSEVVAAFVVLKHGKKPSPQLHDEIIATVRQEMGPVAVIGDLEFVNMLPKTRSGKIMRRVLKAVVLDKDPGDITTIEDEGSVEEARQAWHQLQAGRGQ